MELDPCSVSCDAGRGHSGGVLLGVKENILEVEACDAGSFFFVSMGVRNRMTNFR